MTYDLYIHCVLLSSRHVSLEHIVTKGLYNMINNNSNSNNNDNNNNSNNNNNNSSIQFKHKPVN